MAPADIVFGSAASFLLGVLAASAGWNIPTVVIILALGWVFFLYIKKFAFRFVLLFSFCIFLGAFYYFFYLNLQTARERIVFEKNIDFLGVVQSEPKFSEKSQQFPLKLANPFHGTITVITSPVPEHHYGDLLAIHGTIEHSNYRNLPREEAVSLFPKVTLEESGQGFWVLERLLSFKEKLISGFRALLPSDSAALLSGLTFGSRSDFSNDLKTQMAQSGTTHLVALSGYNISILAIVVAGIFGAFLSRRSTFWATSLVIVLFVLMVGAEASVVRAAIMGFLALLAKESGRPYYFKNAVAFAALLMVIVNPAVLWFDVGFQLSFVSLLGIVYLEPALKHLFRRDRVKTRKPSAFEEVAWTTVSAQLAVLPLLLANFNQASLTAFFANILILEFVPITMGLGFILAFVNFFSTSAARLFAWALYPLLSYELGIISFFAKFGLPMNSTYSPVFFALFYGVLFAVIIWSRSRPPVSV